ncbi:hypothetical protein DKX38_019281 [Salix brachista]|uniref:Aminotransferase-like plant mobile domain-containing protein n=1 Tax=Salix brachista TaxID=2182728 RepID=A0A5N5KFT9_9ROSI|nr:hypothetical protein DKX38_019281 [Salix brachista]
MVNNSKVSRICTVPTLLGDCGEIQKLTVVSGAVNLEVQQTYESHDTATSLSLGSGSARCYKLGPCFDSPSSVEEDNKPVVARLSKYYPSENAKLLVQNFSSLVSWHSWCKNSSPVVGWHIPDETYCKWVKKLEKRLEQKWRDLRIYEAIMLSTRRISFDSPLMSALMCFWDKSCNAFLLPEGPMGITMEDVVAITSCSPVGIELSTLGTDLPDAKNTYLGIGVTSYGNFASRAMALRDKEQEEMSFYLYWICKFIVCNRSVMVLKGFQCVAETIFHAKGPIALAPFLLGLAYNCLGNILRSDFSEHVSGPLWLVVLWAQAYFSPIAASSIATHLRRPRKQNSNSIYSYGDYIIFSQVQCEKTFGECFNYLTDNKRKRQGEEWNPFLKREFGADWFLNFTFHQKLTRDEKDAWKAVLIARDLPAYFSPPSFFLEPYSPNQFARQLGHLQSVPVPFYQTINQPWHSRNTVAANVLKHAEKDYFIRKSAMSQVNQILWRPSSDHAFDFWWLWCWANVASYVSEAKKHFVSKFGNGPRKMHKKRRATRTQKLQRAPKRRARMNDMTLDEYPSSEDPVNTEHEQDATGEGDFTPQQNHAPAVNVEQHRKKLKQYMDMSIESIYETDQLNNMERTVDAIYHHSGDALETPILGDLRKQLTGLKNKIPSLLSSINSAESECGSLHKQNPDLPAKLNQEKLALQADESRLSELTSEEAILELEIQKLMEKKESVLSQKVSAAESAERRKQKIEGLKNIEENIKKAEYSCFQKRNEMSKVNATINATLMDAKRSSQIDVVPTPFIQKQLSGCEEEGEKEKVDCPLMEPSNKRQASHALLKNLCSYAKVAEFQWRTRTSRKDKNKGGIWTVSMGAITERDTTCQQSRDQSVNIEQQWKKLRREMNVLKASNLDNINQLSDMERTVDILTSHYSGDDIKTLILRDMKHLLAELNDRISFMREKLALPLEEPKLSQFTFKESRIEAETQKLEEIKEPVVSQKASAAEIVEEGKQKVDALKNKHEKIKKIEYNRFKWQGKISKFNATTIATSRESKQALYE